MAGSILIGVGGVAYPAYSLESGKIEISLSVYTIPSSLVSDVVARNAISRKQFAKCHFALPFTASLTGAVSHYGMLV